ncbi:pirin family protein [Lentiprolixibacter aurantiacus]|uniref:Pirin family protein n=1 Tax=Lentiprolixibacter aurantiacus TaxID=2993939 RepID=A0AAE3MLY3_9FLAO|nr:pirin family protein [Lentiprolixibacter aurantiacus]MCX2719796.1 pirin family protein [Lentiprolixibacter aurantiacus]
MNSDIKRIYPLGFPWQTQDPFLFCVYHLDHYPQGNEEMGPDAPLEGRNLGGDFVIKDGWRMYHGKKVPGFPYHPHRGFETVTIVNQGYCDHTDSLGAAGRFGEGDVQWMTAGKGVQHSEMFPLINRDAPNTLELFQIWLNLPRQDKLTEPYFKMLWHEDIPIVKRQGVQLRIVAGKWGEEKGVAPPPNSWAANSQNEVGIWEITMDPGASLQLPVTGDSINRSLYLFEGEEVSLNDSQMKVDHGADLVAGAAITVQNGNKQAGLLLLQGAPIAEPVAKYGPFVMNTQEEIQEAMREYRDTEFGGWPWPEAEYVHDRDKGRFALYPDGHLEERN